MVVNAQKYYVYMLLDPMNYYLPFYIGKGSNNRAWVHLLESKSNTDNIRKYYKIQKIRKRGNEPSVIIWKDELYENEAYDLERDLIATFGRKNIDRDGILTNICSDNRPPGKLNKKHKKETLLLMSEKARGRTFSEKTLQKMSEAAKHRFSPSRTGPHSLSTKKKISKSKTNPSAEVRYNLSISHGGKSTTGLINWLIVDKIREQRDAKIKTSIIITNFSFLNPSTVRDIISNRTWKDKFRKTLKEA